MTWEQMEQAVNEARRTLLIVHTHMAFFVREASRYDLKKISGSNNLEALVNLKRQLKNFNIQTKRWNS